MTGKHYFVLTGWEQANFLLTFIFTANIVSTRTFVSFSVMNWNKWVIVWQLKKLKLFVYDLHNSLLCLFFSNCTVPEHTVSFLRVPYTFFVTRQWAFLLFVKREWGFIFPVIHESIFFRPRETGFRLFRDPWNMYLLSRDFWINDFCGNNFSLFFGDFKLVNYTKLDVKLDHSMS